MYSAYCAKQQGIPFGELIVATNENRVLVDVFQTGKYSTYKRQVNPTKAFIAVSTKKWPEIYPPHGQKYF